MHQSSNSNITKTIKIIKKYIYLKFLRSSSILQLFLFETSTVKIAKLANSHFWITLAEIGGFLF